MNDKMERKLNRSGSIILAAAVLLFCIPVSAQLSDGVAATKSWVDTISEYYKAENAFPFDPENLVNHVKIPLEIHVIKNIHGGAGITAGNIIQSVAGANSYFKGAGIQFYIDTLDYVNDYNYGYIRYNNLRKELLAKFTVLNRLNIFIADTIEIGSGLTYGYTYFPDVPDSNYIFLAKSYVSANSLATMIGHFMGLLSTHETVGGKEQVNEKNCSESGDFICDTYADPGLFNEVIDSCRYIGTMRDDTGQYYIPSVANLMSDSPDKCRCILTSLQYRRIYYYYLKYRQYLTY